MTRALRRQQAKRGARQRPEWMTDRYLLGLHRRLYLATGDERYAYAARPGDRMRRQLQGLAAPLMDQMQRATAGG